ncbi:MAG: cytochrome C [Motiliproteus sp.]|nr:cytochrome C [Motiliproteus sp.]MCW9052060.1 cytochrome C [Motiliproteus sp.]
MKHFLIITVIFLAILAVGVTLDTSSSIQTSLNQFNNNIRWQSLSSPGELSQAHQFLKTQCETCHQPLAGVDDRQCILCHSNERSLLIRQPTAFHADIQECSTCHLEHGGSDASLTRMNHSLLVTVGQSLVNTDGADSQDSQALADRLDQLQRQARIHNGGNPLLSKNESLLNCTNCHANDDRHFKLFGEDCGSCHGVDRWTLADFRHPPSSSMDCAQCHQAPPSHYKPHYKKMSQKIAGRPNTPVEQCYQCHQTTAWTDIQQLGLYKHH